MTDHEKKNSPWNMGHDETVQRDAKASAKAEAGAEASAKSPVGVLLEKIAKAAEGLRDPSGPQFTTYNMGKVLLADVGALRAPELIHYSQLINTIMTAETVLPYLQRQAEAHFEAATEPAEALRVGRHYICAALAMQELIDRTVRDLTAEVDRLLTAAGHGSGTLLPTTREYVLSQRDGIAFNHDRHAKDAEALVREAEKFTAFVRAKLQELGLDETDLLRRNMRGYDEDCDCEDCQKARAEDAA